MYVLAQEQHLIEVFREVGLAVLSGVDLAPRMKGKIGIADSASLEEVLAAWHASQTFFSREKKTAVIKSAHAVSAAPAAEKTGTTT